MLTSFNKLFSHLAPFPSKLGRVQYTIFVLLITIIAALLPFSIALGEKFSSGPLVLVFSITFFAVAASLIYTSFIITVKRLHDIKFSFKASLLIAICIFAAPYIIEVAVSIPGYFYIAPYLIIALIPSLRHIEST